MNFNGHLQYFVNKHSLIFQRLQLVTLILGTASSPGPSTCFSRAGDEAVLGTHVKFLSSSSNLLVHVFSKLLYRAPIHSYWSVSIENSIEEMTFYNLDSIIKIAQAKPMIWLFKLKSSYSTSLMDDFMQRLL
jgi:hypothetical protein